MRSGEYSNSNLAIELTEKELLKCAYFVVQYFSSKRNSCRLNHLDELTGKDGPL